MATTVASQQESSGLEPDFSVWSPFRCSDVHPPSKNMQVNQLGCEYEWFSLCQPFNELVTYPPTAHPVSAGIGSKLKPPCEVVGVIRNG